MGKQFDLEQQIMECWHVVDDIDMLYEGVLERDLSKDDIANILLGMKSLYHMKFDRCFGTFEQMIKEHYDELQKLH